MRISVVIGAYNRGSAIAPTLDSALNQVPAPAEVIVVDDGSTDDTANWVRSNYPMVKVERKPNGGTSSARNHGARGAVGDVLVFLDHDDDLLPGAFDVLLRGLRVFPQAGAAFADHAYFNSATGVSYPDHHRSQPAFERLRRVLALEEDQGFRLYGAPMFLALLRGNLLQQPWAVRRRVFHELGGYDERIRLCEDWELYLRLTRDHLVAQCDEVISNHRVHGENLHLAPGQAEMHVKVLELTRRRLRRGELGARLLVRRKLAGYYKAWGDGAQSPTQARAWHRRAALEWPFDAVVLARAIGLPV